MHTHPLFSSLGTSDLESQRPGFSQDPAEVIAQPCWTSTTNFYNAKWGWSINGSHERGHWSSWYLCPIIADFLYRHCQKKLSVSVIKVFELWGKVLTWLLLETQRYLCIIAKRRHFAGWLCILSGFSILSFKVLKRVLCKPPRVFPSELYKEDCSFCHLHHWVNKMHILVSKIKRARLVI